MTSSRPSPTTIHRTPIRRGRVAGLLAVVALAAVLADRLPATSTSSAPPRLPDVEIRAPRIEHRAPPARVADDGIPGLDNLDPDLARAVRRAAAAAAGDGVVLRVDSGWRSAEHQQRLLDEAVSKFGSSEEAARWVATPERSAHVSGDAVDVGPSEAAAWLSRHGARYGLCRIYSNEPWHFELRPEAVADGCPPMYADPTHDPRMQ